jgi:hypothetical protein
MTRQDNARPGARRLPLRQAAAVLAVLLLGALVLVARPRPASAATLTFGPSADTYVNQASPGTSYGTSPDLNVRGGSGSERRALLAFSVSGIPSGQIGTATLSVYARSVTTIGTFRVFTAGSFTESSTWNSGVTVGTTQLGSGTTKPSTRITVPIGTVANGTVRLALTAPSTQTGLLVFGSRQYATADGRPVLTVTTGPAPTTTTVAPTTTTVAPTTTTVAPTTTTAPPARALLWSDEFNAAAGTGPDNLKWRGDNYDESGRLNTWTRDLENAQHDGQGNLILTAVKEPSGTGRSYTSAQLKNQYVRPDLFPGAQPFFHKYGRWEVRVKLPGAQGIWPGLWAMGDYDNTPGGWPECGELDIIETINNATSAEGHLHMPKGANADDYGPGVSKPGTWADGQFHTFAVEWTPGRVEWFADGISYGAVTRAQAEAAGATWVFDDKPQSPIVDLAVGGWAGTPDPSWTRQQLVIDYYRVYAEQP